jgi:hypothetical protein
MNSKVEVSRDYDSRPSSLLSIIHPKSLDHKHILSSEGTDELTPLLPGALEDKTPSSKHLSRKKDKEMIPAAKLASDASSRGRALRPAHVFSRIDSESMENPSKELEKSWSEDDGINSTKYGNSHNSHE